MVARSKATIVCNDSAWDLAHKKHSSKNNTTIILMSSVISSFPVVLVIKNSPASAGDIRNTGSILGSEDLLEEGTATHSSILAWRITWAEEPGRLQSIGSYRVGHDCSHLARPQFYMY